MGRRRSVAVRLVAALMAFLLVAPAPLEALARARAGQRAARAAVRRMGRGLDDGDASASRAKPPEPPAGRATAAAVLPLPLRPLSAAWLAPADAKGDPWVLFDGRGTTALQASSSEPVRIGVALEESTEVSAITLLGPAQGTLTVLSQTGSSAPVQSLKEVAVLAKAGEWKRVELPAPARAERLVLQWAATAPSGPSEIGLWGLGAARHETSDTEVADRVLAGSALGGASVTATPKEALVTRVGLGPNGPSSPDRPAVFHAALAADPRSFARAFLVYELAGLPHFTDVVRQINGLEPRGGALASPSQTGGQVNDGGLQVEEIAPDWLRAGDNEIRFLPVPVAGAADYTIRNVRLVGLAPAEVVESRVPTTQTGEQRIAFESRSQPHDVVFELLKPSEGQFTVRGAAKGGAPVKIDLHGLETGWHRFAVDALGPTEAVTVALDGKHAARSVTRVNEDPRPTIADVALTASALPRVDAEDRIVVSYPLHGECVNRKVHVRGFLARGDSGQASGLRANGQLFDDAIGSDRSFALTIPEPTTSAGRAWQVALEAPLSDGRVLTRTVHVEPCLESASALDSSLHEDEGAPFGAVVRAGEKTTITFAGAKLDIPEGAVDHDVRITMRPLVQAQVPKMGPLMRNVSPDGRAFRFGPHGLKFKKPVKLTLPYDPAVISAGMRENDIYSFYFDEKQGKWQKIGRFGIARDGQLVNLSEHFTDFVSATLAMPDEPGVKSFNPNDMKGIKLASPVAGIDLIAPPQANSLGSARLNYPIETPPGRNGVGPELAVTYDSDRKNGWMGVGWDVSVSKIEVDTRFGVPVTSLTAPTEYDGNEIYDLDGQMLTALDSTGTTFQRRIEGSFEQIQHKGKGAQSTWVVTDKKGITYNYGEADATTGVQAVLAPRDSSNKITGPVSAYYLTSVVDLFGNTMTVHYLPDSGFVDTAHTVPWVQMYPKQIDYTSNPNGFGSTGQLEGSNLLDGNPHYHVIFTVDGGARDDQISSARTGFVVLTSRLLTQIDVKLDTEIIRSYHFNYGYGAFEKSLLQNIQMFGQDDTTQLYQQSFQYSGVTTDSSGVLQGFAAPTAWSNVSIDSLASSTETQGGLSGYAGIGPTICFPHIGLGGGFSGGGDSTSTAFVDMNGDGLPDLVNENNLLLNQPNSSFTGGSFNLSTNVLPQTTLASSEHLSASLNASAHFFDEFLGAGFSQNWSWTTEQQALQDVNGDGFPDLLSSNGATLLQGGAALGSSMSGVPLSSGGSGDPSQGQLGQAYYSTSVLVGWNAPFDGNIAVTGPISLQQSQTNGVVAHIIYYQEGFNALQGHTSTQFPLWTHTVSPGDPACVPTADNGTCSGLQGCTVPSSCNGSKPISLTVSKGDNVYFLLDPTSNTDSNATNWNPTITYTGLCSGLACSTNPTKPDLTQTDAFGLPLYVYSQPTDFRISTAQAPGWIANSDGQVVIGGSLNVSQSTNDLTIKLFRKSADSAAISLITQQTVHGHQTGPVTLDPSQWTVFVNQGDTLYLDANYSSASVDPGNVQWKPTTSYTQVCGSDGTLSDCRTLTCPSMSSPTAQCTLSSLPQDPPGLPLTVPLSAIVQDAQVTDSSSRMASGPTQQTFSVPRSGQVALQGTVQKQATNAPVELVVNDNGLDVFKEQLSQQAIMLAANVPSTSSPPVLFNVKAGDVFTFTTYAQSQADAFTPPPNVQPLTVWSPALVYQDNMQSVPVSAVNVEITPTPGGPNTLGMSGTFRNWSYGEWTTQIPFNEADITNPSNTGSPVHFTPVSPHWEGIVRPSNPTSPNQPSTLPGILTTSVPGPLFTGSGADFYIGNGSGNGGWKPSRVGGVAPEKLGSSPGLAKSLSSTLTASINAGGSLAQAWGTTDEQRQLLDLNGDHRPDVLSDGQAQFQICVNAGGNAVPCDGSEADYSYGPAQNTGASGSPRHVRNRNVSFGLGFGSTASAIAQEAKSSGTTKAVLSVLPSLGQSYGTSAIIVDSVDVNGDGLPDRVSDDGTGDLSVQLNLGYGFAPSVSWQLGSWSNGLNTDPNIPPQSGTPSLNPVAGAGNDVANAIQSVLTNPIANPLGAAIDGEDHGAPTPDVLRYQDNVTNSLQIGYGGVGGGYAYSASRTLVDFLDVNGDGLPDRVLHQPGSSVLWVRLNRGSSFAPAQQWSLPAWDVALQGNFTQDINGTNDALFFSENQSFNLGAGVPILIPLEFVCLSIEIAATITSGGGASELTWQDVDGDGALDQVLKLKSDGSLRVKLNQTAQANLLTTVTRPLGGSMTLGYQREGNVVATKNGYNVDMPTNQWALASVTVSDGTSGAIAQPNIVETFSYGDPADGTPSGFYDRTEREGYGYHYVTTTRSDGSQHVDVYDTSDYYHRGLLLQSTERDGAGNLFTSVEMKYQALSSALPSLTGSFFPFETSRTTKYYEGTTTDITQPAVTKTETPTFDALGNLLTLTDSGDVGLNNSVLYQVTYDPTLAMSRIFKPSEVTATGSTGVLRDRQATYDGQASLRAFKYVVTGGTKPDGTPYSGTLATWTYTPDAFGNVSMVVDPRGYTLNYVYDTTVNTYVTQVTDSFEYPSSTLYDLRYGIPLLETDVNGNKTMFGYDPFGRLTSVDGPYDIGATEHTIAMAYSQPPAANQPAAFPAYATTKHKDVQHPGDPITTSTFVDGLARVIETKKDISRDDGTNITPVMAVSGAVTFDGRGRLIHQGQPTFDSSLEPTTFVTPTMNHASVYGYDVLNRVTSFERPDGALTKSTYGFDTLDGTPRLATTVLDPNVNAGPPLPGTAQEAFHGVRGNTLAVKQSNHLTNAGTATTLTTRYAYDAVEEMLQVTDAKGNTTSVQYDTVGRMVSLTSPDAGRTDWRYDLSGNLAVKQTPNLRAQNQVIQYQYDFNRLQSIVYPTTFPVSYTYGSSSQTGDANGNVAGRIIQEVSEAGTKTYEYDRLGNVVQQAWHVNSLEAPWTAGYDETMSYTFDSFGRMLTATFPNVGKEVVSYGYDSGGNVTQATGVNSVLQTNEPNTTMYVLNVGYDEFEQRTRFIYGNGISQSYAYDPLTRRLTSVNASENDPTLQLYGKPPRPFEQMVYSYDPVGNLTQIRNDTPYDDTDLAFTLPATVAQNFTYDDLYQLKTADGAYQEHGYERQHYGLQFGYDAIGNILSKTQTNDMQVPSGSGGWSEFYNIREQSYAARYSYAGTRPHAPTEIDELYTGDATTNTRSLHYDADGNQAGWLYQGITDRETTWNEEDRIQQMTLNGVQMQQALYDGSGDRVVNLQVPQGTPPDPLEPPDPTAYYETVAFGSELTLRNMSFLTRHISFGDARIASKMEASDIGPYPTTLYYHDDHLGSTHFLTNDDQELVAHQEYFPSGELWVDEVDSRYATRMPYLFNGKTLDVATGLYYYGARYYDPHLSQWTSPDPILAGYVKRGAIARAPDLLGLYEFAWNNPLVVRDPDGRQGLPLSVYDRPGHSGETVQGAMRFEAEHPWLTIAVTTLALVAGSIMTAQPEGLAAVPEVPAVVARGAAAVGGAVSSPKGQEVLDQVEQKLPALENEAQNVASQPAVQQSVRNAGQAVGEGVEHIALGLEDVVRERAASVGATHLMNDPNWKRTFMDALAGGTTRFTVFLDNLVGRGGNLDASAYDKVMTSVTRNATAVGGATDFEISQLYQAGRLGSVTFMEHGEVVSNPFQ